MFKSKIFGFISIVLCSSAVVYADDIRYGNFEQSRYITGCNALKAGVYFMAQSQYLDGEFPIQSRRLEERMSEYKQYREIYNEFMIQVHEEIGELKEDKLKLGALINSKAEVYAHYILGKCLEKYFD